MPSPLQHVSSLPVVSCVLQHAAPALDMRGAGSGGKFSSSSSVLSSSNVFSGPASAVLSSLNSRLESSLAVLGIKLPGAMRGEDLDPLQPFRSECRGPPEVVMCTGFLSSTAGGMLDCLHQLLVSSDNCSFAGIQLRLRS